MHLWVLACKCHYMWDLQPYIHVSPRFLHGKTSWLVLLPMLLVICWQASFVCKYPSTASLLKWAGVFPWRLACIREENFLVEANHVVWHFHFCSKFVFVFVQFFSLTKKSGSLPTPQTYFNKWDSFQRGPFPKKIVWISCCLTAGHPTHPPTKSCSTACLGGTV